MDMVPRSISDKLDQIGTEELGITLDQTQLWEKLDSRLSSRAGIRKIVIAAAKPCFVDKPISQYFLIGKLCFIFSLS